MEEFQREAELRNWRRAGPGGPVQGWLEPGAGVREAMSWPSVSVAYSLQLVIGAQLVFLTVPIHGRKVSSQYPEEGSAILRKEDVEEKGRECHQLLGESLIKWEGVECCASRELGGLLAVRG